VKGTILDGLLASLAEADDESKRELAGHLRPYLGDDPSRLLSLIAKANQLNLHPDTLCRMARDGRIPAVKIGREWRFRADQSEIRSPAANQPPIPNGSPPIRRPSRTAPASIAAIRGTPTMTER
jgi:excisionase family DNA binding protein